MQLIKQLLMYNLCSVIASPMVQVVRQLKKLQLATYANTRESGTRQLLYLPIFDSISIFLQNKQSEPPNHKIIEMSSIISFQKKCNCSSDLLRKEFPYLYFQNIEMGCCASNDAIGINQGYQSGNLIPNSNDLSPTKLSKFKGQTFTPFDHPLYQGELGEASKLFFFEEFVEAAEIYKRYIERLAEDTAQDIDGLGQTQMSLGYYQWFVFRWYKEGIEKREYIGTVYDALSLCYQALKDQDQQMAKGIKWYQEMVDQHPENHALVMGYANILNNKGIFEEAIDYYNRVLDLKPKWVRPLQCMAYIHEYKRISKKASCETANKILSFDPTNRVALFVLSRNQPTPDEKIAKLKEVMNLHPKYARCVNQIGIVYGGTKKEYRQAITWYQKASEITPEYASCYNNIGVNFELLKDYDEAIVWYFRGIEKDKEYKAPHKNLSDIFDSQNFTDEMIQEHMKKYKIFPDYFYYYMGLSYYDKKKYDISIKYYMKAYDCADELKKHIYKIHNSTGITYDDMRQDDNALKYYTKCIGANHKYHSAYYNMAIVFKRQKKIDDAINWYQKAIEVNPRYSYAYNNLANIYKDQMKYEEAIKCYKKAVQYLSTYTLALVNLGVCFLKIQNYREAFNAMERAKQCLPTDNNNLSAGNKTFMNQSLQKFDKEGESWRQNGCITPQQRNKLRNLTKSFESNFGKTLNAEGREPMSIEKILKKQVLKIVRLVYDDKFELKHIDEIYDLIKQIFEDNEEYFHILPQLFVQYFHKNVFEKKRPILDIEKELFSITKRLSAKTVAELKTNDSLDHKGRQNITFKMKHFDPPKNNKVNLFKAAYFNSYEQVYGEIMHANEAAGRSYQDFKNLVDYVRKQSYGTLYGIGMKIPRDEGQQYKVILRIFEKMFKQELTQPKVKDIICKIDEALKKTAETKQSTHVGIGDVVHGIMDAWTKEITQMVKQRKVKKIQTKCEVSDLLRAKVMFDSIDHLKMAINAVDELSNVKGYRVIEMDNRLNKKQTQDVVFKLQIKDAVCEFQLALKQDEGTYHFTHCIYEIERSPLGCIFGSYIYMSKGFAYPFPENCKDIVEQLKNAKSSDDALTYEAAKYVVETLKEDG